MTKWIGTLAALATLMVQIASLSSMITSETPPPAVQAAVAAIAAIGSFLSEQRLTGNAPPAPPRSLLSKLWYGLHVSSAGAWQIWMAICLALGIIVFVGKWALETATWGFLDLDDAVEAIKFSVVMTLIATGLKLVWLVGRFTYSQLA